jgi:hypothetical protein
LSMHSVSVVDNEKSAPARRHLNQRWHDLSNPLIRNDSLRATTSPTCLM